MGISFLESLWAFFKMPFVWIGFGSMFLLWAVPKLYILCQRAFKEG